MDRQGRENTGGISVVHGCSTFFLSFHVTADEYSREPRRSSIQLLNQGEETNFRRGSSRTVAHLPSPPLPRITLLLRLRNIFFTARGGGGVGGGGRHQTGNGFISRFLRATSGVSDFTLKTLSFAVSLFRDVTCSVMISVYVYVCARQAPMEKQWSIGDLKIFNHSSNSWISRRREWTSCFNAFDDCRVVPRERVTRRSRVKPYSDRPPFHCIDMAALRYQPT